MVKLFLVCPKVQYSGQHCFLVYINDLRLVLSECIVDIFTDDSTILANKKNIDQVAPTLFNELQQVNKWCEKNHMTINISKTKLMYVTSTQHIVNYQTHIVLLVYTF